MRIRALLTIPMSIVMAVLGVGSMAASAATLYTDASHTTAVPLGTTAIASSGALVLTSGNTPINSCSSSKLTLSLTRNSSGSVAANVTGGTMSGCRLATTPNTTTPWRVSISGDCSTPVSPTEIWRAASISALSFTWAGGTYTGNLTTGVSAQQPNSTRAPVSIVLNNAAMVTGPLTSNGHLTGTYVLTGAAASYSLGGSGPNC